MIFFVIVFSHLSQVFVDIVVVVTAAARLFVPKYQQKLECSNVSLATF